MTVVSNGKEEEVQEVELVSCMCGDVDHHVIISRYNWSDDPANPEYEYSFNVTLSQSKSFVERIWVALKYIFGYNAGNYYHDIILTDKQFRNIPNLFGDKHEEIGESTPEVEKVQE